MRIVRTLDITSDEFFDYIEHRVLGEIERAGGKPPLPSQLCAGLRYVSDPDDRYRRSEVTILDYERGCRYRSRIVTLADDVTMCYTVEPHGTSVEVTFVQERESFRIRRQGRLMRGFSEAVYLSRMAESLMGIQNSILDARAGLVGSPQRADPGATGPALTGYKLLRKLADRSR